MDATYTTDTNTIRKKHRKVIDLTAIDTDKARAQTITCMGATLITSILAIACWVCGICLPIWVETVTDITVWIAMGLAFTGFGLMAVSRWINRNTLS